MAESTPSCVLSRLGRAIERRCCRERQARPPSPEKPRTHARRQACTTPAFRDGSCRAVSGRLTCRRGGGTHDDRTRKANRVSAHRGHMLRRGTDHPACRQRCRPGAIVPVSGDARERLPEHVGRDGDRGRRVTGHGHEGGEGSPHHLTRSPLLARFRTWPDDRGLREEQATHDHLRGGDAVALVGVVLIGRHRRHLGDDAAQRLLEHARADRERLPAAERSRMRARHEERKLDAGGAHRHERDARRQRVGHHHAGRRRCRSCSANGLID